MSEFNYKEYLKKNPLTEDQKSFLLNHESIRAFGLLRNAFDQIVKEKADDEELREYQIIKDELEDILDRYFDFIVEMDKRYPN